MMMIEIDQEKQNKTKANRICENACVLIMMIGINIIIYQETKKERKNFSYDDR